MTRVYDTATDLITFARLQSQNTTSGSSYLGSDGLLKFAAEDEPRIEYGSDGSLKGLLIEEQRTNLLTHSEDFSNAAWGKFGGGVIVADAATSPDGTSNASQFYGSDGAHVIEDVSATAGTTYTQSVFLKTNGTDVLTVSINYRDGGGNAINYYGVDFNTATGVISAPDLGVQATTSNVENFENGWFRLSISHEAPATTTTARIYIANRTGAAASSSDGYLLYGAQLEAGSFPTSYIPTSGSQVTRSADLASIPVSAFGYNDQAGTIVVEYSTFHTYTGSPYPRVVTLSQVGAASRTSVEILGYAAFTSFEVYDLGAIQASLLAGGGGGDKAAIAFAQDDVQAAKDGSLVGATDTSATIVPYTDMFIGMFSASGSAHISGHIKSLKYYPRRLTNTQLQELTS